MEKRTLLAVAICMGILWGWWKLFPPATPPPARVAATNAAGAPPSSLGVPNENSAKPTEAGARAPEARVSLEGGKARFVFSSWGGVLREVFLKEERFLQNKKDPKSGFQFIATQTPETAPLRLSFPGADFPTPEGGAWTVSQPSADQVIFRVENDRVALEKRFRLTDAFQLSLEVMFENKGDRPLNPALALHVSGRQDPEKKGKGFWDVSSANLATMVCFADDSVKRANIESLHKEAVEKSGLVKWVAADDKYFAVAVVPHNDTAPGPRKCVLRAPDGLTGEAFVALANRTVAPGAKSTYAFTIFAGPKYTSELGKVAPNGQGVSLEKDVDVTLAVLSRPLLALLKIFHGWVGNWGVAIIMLTLFVKLLTFYPTQKAMLSGKKMQRLGPKLAVLKKKHENDRQRLGVETMNLYKTEGVSPFGGCLPTLITMPIWIALFSTLNYSVELHRVPFFGYIHDLSARDPYFITPLIMGAIMFLQMRMSPAGADPQQQKMMAVMMPVMFTAFSLFLPAGLALYTLTNSTLAIAQQVVVNRMDRRLAAAGA